jgi:hypothetical protein
VKLCIALAQELVSQREEAGGVQRRFLSSPLTICSKIGSASSLGLGVQCHLPLVVWFSRQWRLAVSGATDMIDAPSALWRPSRLASVLSSWSS